jgi:acetyl esterase/lipase
MPSSSTGGLTAAAATRLRDEALAAAKALEDEAVSLESSNAERSRQLQEDAETLKSAAAAQ